MPLLQIVDGFFFLILFRFIICFIQSNFHKIIFPNTHKRWTWKKININKTERIDAKYTAVHSALGLQAIGSVSRAFIVYLHAIISGDLNARGHDVVCGEFQNEFDKWKMKIQ